MQPPEQLKLRAGQEPRPQLPRSRARSRPKRRRRLERVPAQARSRRGRAAPPPLLRLPRPAGSAASTAAARQSSWRDPDVVEQELQPGPSAGEGRPQMTSLSCPAPSAPAEAAGSLRIPDRNPDRGLYAVARGAGQSVRLRASGLESLSQPCNLPSRDSEAPHRATVPPAPALPLICKYTPYSMRRRGPQSIED